MKEIESEPGMHISKAAQRMVDAVKSELHGIGQMKLLKRVMYGFCEACLFVSGRHFCKHKSIA